GCSAREIALAIGDSAATWIAAGVVDREVRLELVRCGVGGSGQVNGGRRKVEDFVGDRLGRRPAVAVHGANREGVLSGRRDIDWREQGEVTVAADDVGHRGGADVVDGRIAPGEVDAANTRRVDLDGRRVGRVRRSSGTRNE